MAARAKVPLAVGAAGIAVMVFSRVVEAARIGAECPDAAACTWELPSFLLFGGFVIAALGFVGVLVQRALKSRHRVQ